MQAVKEQQTVEPVEETSVLISSSLVMRERQRHALAVILSAIGYAVERVENPAQVTEFLLGCWTRREGDQILPLFS